MLKYSEKPCFRTFRLGLLENLTLWPDVTLEMTTGISITITTSYFVDLCNHRLIYRI